MEFQREILHIHSLRNAFLLASCPHVVFSINYYSLICRPLFSFNASLFKSILQLVPPYTLFLARTLQSPTFTPPSDRDIKHDVIYALSDTSVHDPNNNNGLDKGAPFTTDGDQEEEEEDFDSGVSCGSSRVASPLYRARENKRLRLKGGAGEPKNPREIAEPVRLHTSIDNI